MDSPITRNLQLDVEKSTFAVKWYHHFTHTQGIDSNSYFNTVSAWFQQDHGWALKNNKTTNIHPKCCIFHKKSLGNLVGVAANFWGIPCFSLQLENPSHQLLIAFVSGGEMPLLLRRFRPHQCSPLHNSGVDIHYTHCHCLYPGKFFTRKKFRDVSGWKGKQTGWKMVTFEKYLGEWSMRSF